MNSPHPPSPPRSAAAAADTKLRLMCRYGGQILPRPRSKSLYYLGGETRIVSVNRKTINDLSSFVSHLASSFSIQFPFSIKYQLPSHDLDSLVSLSSDEDFHLMLDEQLRFSSSGRIRLFLFFSNPEPKKIQKVIDHPKTEDWFVDVLKSAKKLQKAGDRVVDFDGETANDVSGLAESMVLETSSSFGSSSSSASLSNVPPIKVQEDGLVNLLENIVKLPSSESIATLSSDSGNQAADCEAKIGTREEPNLQVCSDENGVSASHVNLGNRTYIHDPSAKNPVHKMNEVNINVRSSQLYPVQESAKLFVPSGTHNIPQNLSTMLPIASYYPMQQQMLNYQQNHAYPFYFVPQVSQPYNFPVHFSLIDAPIAPSNQSQSRIHLNPPLILPQVAYKEANEIPSSLKPRFHNKPYDECELNIIPPQTCYFSQPIEASHNEVKSVISEFDGGLEHSQIYKSQPPPPVFPSKQQAKSEPSRI